MEESNRQEQDEVLAGKRLPNASAAFPQCNLKEALHLGKNSVHQNSAIELQRTGKRPVERLLIGITWHS